MWSHTITAPTAPFSCTRSCTPMFSNVTVLRGATALTHLLQCIQLHKLYQKTVHMNYCTPMHSNVTVLYNIWNQLQLYNRTTAQRKTMLCGDSLQTAHALQCILLELNLKGWWFYIIPVPEIIDANWAPII